MVRVLTCTKRKGKEKKKAFSAMCFFFEKRPEEEEGKKKKKQRTTQTSHLHKILHQSQTHDEIYEHPIDKMQTTAIFSQL